MSDWASLLMDAGIIVPSDKDEFNIECPFHDDMSPSLSINIEKGMWICHVGCGQGSIKYFLSKYLGIPWKTMDNYLLNKAFDFDLNIFDSESQEEEELEEVEFPFQQGYVPAWIFDRDFNKATLEKWGCGIDHENSLIIPIHTSEKLVGWISRRQYMSPKYLYSKGLRKSRVLFGINHVEPTDFICVTEGSLDTMWLDQNGYTSVALLGANMSRQQEDLLLSLPTKEIVLCLDNDQAGRNATEKSLTRLSTKCIVSSIKIPQEYKDVQDIRNKNELDRVIETRILW